MRVVKIEYFVDDIVRCVPQAYLFQDVVEQHGKLSARAGPAVSCVRFVTVMDDAHPRILYTSWKIASPAAMADNFWQEGSMLARVSPESGIVENCVTGRGPEAREVTEHPASGMPIIGFRIPLWTAAADMVRNAPAIFPIKGCLGRDVAIGPDGPLTIECNDNPGNEFYQMVDTRGILKPEVKPILDRVEARNKYIIEDRKARVYKTQFRNRVEMGRSSDNWSKWTISCIVTERSTPRTSPSPRSRPRSAHRSTAIRRRR